MLKRLIFGLAALVALAVPGFATTYTTCSGYAKPAPGDPAVANTWGTILNTNFDLIDSSGGGNLSLSVAGSSDVVLTSTNGAADQARHAYFNLTGALTGNIYVFWPNAKCRSFVVHNGTTGAYTLTVAVSNGSGTPAPAGSTYAVPQGETVALISDGVSIVPANTPAGIGAATSGANSNITSLTGLTTPLTKAQGGTGNTTGQPSGTAGGVLSGTFPNPGFASIANGTMLANTSGSSAAPTATAIPTMHMQVFTSSGTFTVPANATTSTVFKFTVTGGGGSQSSSFGGSGATGIKYVSGLTAGSTITVTVGAGGAASAGGNSSIGVSGTPTAQGGTIVNATAASASGFDLNIAGGGCCSERGAPSFWGGANTAAAGGAYGSGGSGTLYPGIGGVVTVEWVL